MPLTAYPFAWNRTRPRHLRRVNIVILMPLLNKVGETRRQIVYPFNGSLPRTEWTSVTVDATVEWCLPLMPLIAFPCGVGARHWSNFIWRLSPRTHCFANCGCLEEKSVIPLTVTVPSHTVHRETLDSFSMTLALVRCPSAQIQVATYPGPNSNFVSFPRIRRIPHVSYVWTLRSKIVEPFQNALT